MSTRKPGIFVSVIALLLMIAAPSVSAQGNVISPVVPGTITVVGEGTATVPAETASVAITIGPDTNYYPEPMAIQPEGEAGTVPATEPVDVSGVVDAIIAHGIPVNDVEVLNGPFMGEWGAGMTAQPVSILVTVADPTVDALSNLLDVVLTSAHEDGLYVNQFGVLYSVADCRDVRQQARADAVENAREEAEDQAAAMDVTLGAAVSSRDTYPMSASYFPLNTCTSAPEMQPYSMVYMAMQFDPGMPAEVSVSVAVEVTFEIP